MAKNKMITSDYGLPNMPDSGKQESTLTELVQPNSKLQTPTKFTQLNSEELSQNLSQVKADTSFSPTVAVPFKPANRHCVTKEWNPEENNYISERKQTDQSHSPMNRSSLSKNE